MADYRRRGRLDPELEAAAEDGEDVLGDETPAQVDLMDPPAVDPPPLEPVAPPEPRQLPELPVVGMPLVLSPVIALAFEGVITALRTDRRFRQQVRMAAGRLQGHANQGPLTALVDAIVGSA